MHSAWLADPTNQPCSRAFLSAKDSVCFHLTQEGPNCRDLSACHSPQVVVVMLETSVCLWVPAPIGTSEPLGPDLITRPVSGAHGTMQDYKERTFL